MYKLIFDIPDCKSYHNSGIRVCNTEKDYRSGTAEN